MKKYNLFLILKFIIIGYVSIACSEKTNFNHIKQQENYSLNAFKIKVAGSYYHGNIDQEKHIIEIGGVVEGNTITGVEYNLKNSKSTILPDPKSFMGNWKKEQTVEVTNEDNTKTTYTIRLTKLKEANNNVLFMDDFDVDGSPDQNKWVLSKKGTSDWNDEMSESYDEAYVKDGKLFLVAQKVGDTYRAGGIETNGKFDFTFGKVEVRARIAQSPNGAFPAIWMMPKKFIYPGWPDCGEIDIMEHIKQESFIHQTLHTNYTTTLGLKTPSNSKTTVINYKDFNVYGMQWTAEKLTFYVNGQETFSYANLNLADEAVKRQWPFTKDAAFYLILNMGLGGNKAGSWAGPIADNQLPAIMEVDWVKVSEIE